MSRFNFKFHIAQALLNGAILNTKIQFHINQQGKEMGFDYDKPYNKTKRVYLGSVPNKSLPEISFQF